MTHLRTYTRYEVSGTVQYMIYDAVCTDTAVFDPLELVPNSDMSYVLSTTSSSILLYRAQLSPAVFAQQRDPHSHASYNRTAAAVPSEVT